MMILGSNPFNLARQIVQGNVIRPAVTIQPNITHEPAVIPVYVPPDVATVPSLADVVNADIQSLNTLPPVVVTGASTKQIGFMQKVYTWVSSKPKTALFALLATGIAIGYGIGYFVCKRSKRR